MNTARAFDLLCENFSGAVGVIDVGARWGMADRWLRFADRIEALCFDPDQDECDKQNALANPSVRYIPLALDEANGRRELHVAQEPACSSFYPPVEKLCESYPCLDIIKTTNCVSVPCMSLDSFMLSHEFSDISAIKLDTQGSELSVLHGAVKSIEHCAIIDIEVEFNELYTGQPLFCDVDRFLRDQGFVLWRFENLAHYAPEAVEAARSNFFIAGDPNETIFTTAPNGQLFWAQAQYVPKKFPRTGASSLPMQEAFKGAAIAAAYGFWDLSLELVRKSGSKPILAELILALNEDV